MCLLNALDTVASGALPQKRMKTSVLYVLGFYTHDLSSMDVIGRETWLSVVHFNLICSTNPVVSEQICLQRRTLGNIYVDISSCRANGECRKRDYG